MDALNARRTRKDAYHGNGRTCGEARDGGDDEEHSLSRDELEHMTFMGAQSSQQL